MVKTVKRRMLTAYLREDRAEGYAVLPSGQVRVDRDKGIIYGVKVVSRTSPNKHGMPGADSTEYTVAALKEAIPLYEGLDVYIDHASKDEAGKVRACRDRFGKLLNVRPDASGELYADLLYVKSHEMAGPITEAAEDPMRQDFFALSHNAYGQGDVVNRVYRISKIPKVESVDIVTKGGTNRSLLESAEMEPKQVKLRELAEKYVTLKEKLQPLFKVLPTAGEILVQEADEGGDYRDHLHMAKKVCEDNEDWEKAEQIHKLMKPGGKEVEEDEEDGADEERKGAGEKKTEESGSDESGKKPAGTVLLQESLAKDLLKVSGIRETPNLLKAIRESGTPEKALGILTAIKESAPQRGVPTGPPPTVRAGGSSLTLKDVRAALPRR